LSRIEVVVAKEFSQLYPKLSDAVRFSTFVRVVMILVVDPPQRYRTGARVRGDVGVLDHVRFCFWKAVAGRDGERQWLLIILATCKHALAATFIRFYQVEV